MAATRRVFIAGVDSFHFQVHPHLFRQIGIEIAPPAPPIELSPEGNHVHSPSMELVAFT